MSLSWIKCKPGSCFLSFFNFQSIVFPSFHWPASGLDFLALFGSLNHRPCSTTFSTPVATSLPPEAGCCAGGVLMLGGAWFGARGDDLTMGKHTGMPSSLRRPVFAAWGESRCWVQKVGLRCWGRFAARSDGARACVSVRGVRF